MSLWNAHGKKGGKDLPSKRYVNLSQYGISDERRMEMVAFALQYKEWIDGLSRQENPKLRQKVNLVEYAANQSSEEIRGDYGLAEYIIKNVTENRPYWYLKQVMRMPYRDKEFYAARKRFFVILNQEKD